VFTELLLREGAYIQRFVSLEKGDFLHRDIQRAGTNFLQRDFEFFTSTR